MTYEARALTLSMGWKKRIPIPPAAGPQLLGAPAKVSSNNFRRSTSTLAVSHLLPHCRRPRSTPPAPHLLPSASSPLAPRLFLPAADSDGPTASTPPCRPRARPRLRPLPPPRRLTFAPTQRPSPPLSRRRPREARFTSLAARRRSLRPSAVGVRASRSSSKRGKVERVSRFPPETSTPLLDGLRWEEKTSREKGLALASKIILVRATPCPICAKLQMTQQCYSVESN
ncbi:hypothetical protein BS78_04G058100 [Paspalum vaginatum]|nr:hypothetical protein BS78_04G058100 [Paspalum vaginatum]